MKTMSVLKVFNCLLFKFIRTGNDIEDNLSTFKYLNVIYKCIVVNNFTRLITVQF